MRTTFVTAALATAAFAARSFLDEPDTGIDDVLGDLEVGQLPNVTEMVGLNDFQWAARHYLPGKNYTYYRNGAGGEWSYRNNLEVYNRYSLKARVLNDITNVEDSMSTTILGFNFSNPFFISPCARADYAHPDAELNLMKAASAADTLYIISGFATKSIEEIAAVAAENYTFFSQLYTTSNDTANQILFDRSEAAGAKALIWSIDAPGSPSRQRASRYGVTSAVTKLTRLTWDVYAKYQKMTTLPIILKGIQSAADARAAIKHGVPAIILSNHGGRNLDGSRSSLEVALEIYKEDPAVFREIEVLADGGVRYGTDALRLMALGVKAVGLGRPIMFSNVFGEEGVAKAIEIMHSEVMNDAANLGVADLKKINAEFVDWTPNNWYS
ncbi:FMN-dependent dehydrogenase [Pseudomassariella vexata]|uniref:FMN-dependent dehydrogenase n=1 Tax=Pseudomassariella vexata TaxID=1141098 RepID=A0A1Y2DLL3_9PEZI|nr:FMN-dependent dehydrogenase [Pseudomassariella vexata]ORY60029.1 FMN-dependent dehydrogenase [Pseudomassariella vexata]